MLRRDYFVAAAAAKAYYNTAWVFDCFSITFPKSEELPSKADYPYQLFKDEEVYFFFNEDGEREIIQDAQVSQPLFAFLDTLPLKAGELENLNTAVVTTYGTALVNLIVCVYPFGSKIPFQEGLLNVRHFESIIEKRLEDNPPAGEERDPEKLYVDEYMEFNKAINSLSAYTQLVVPSATPRMLVANPAIKQRKAELLEQYKDQLDDPVIQAKIGEELVQMDRDWIKGDAGERFYIKGKFYDVIRKKRFVIHGSESGFGITGELITGTLEEGWDVKHLPSMSNGLRDGSYSRGASTALGGEATKFNYRMMQNAVVVDGDCGSTVGMQITLTKKYFKNFLGRYWVTPKGLVEITADHEGDIVDRPILIRSPLYCHTPGNNYCSKCVGVSIAKTPTALAAYAADVSSTFMLASMKAMHGKALSVQRWDWKRLLT